MRYGAVFRWLGFGLVLGVLLAAHYGFPYPRREGRAQPPSLGERPQAAPESGQPGRREGVPWEPRALPSDREVVRQAILDRNKSAREKLALFARAKELGLLADKSVGYQMAHLIFAKELSVKEKVGIVLGWPPGTETFAFVMSDCIGGLIENADLAASLEILRAVPVAERDRGAGGDFILSSLVRYSPAFTVENLPKFLEAQADNSVQEAMARGLSLRIVNDHKADPVQVFQKWLDLGDQLPDVFARDLVGRYVGYAMDSDSAKVADWLLAQEGDRSEQGDAAFVSRLAAQDRHQESMDFIKRLFDKGQTARANEATRALGMRWSADNPKACLDWACALPKETRSKDEILLSALVGYFHRDPEAAQLRASALPADSKVRKDFDAVVAPPERKK